MPEGPFGFPRLTNLGPFVSSKKQAPTRTQLQERSLDSFNRLNGDDVSDVCKPYVNINSPVEFIIPIEKAEAVAAIEYPIENNQDVFDAVSTVTNQYSNKFIGIHETEQENAARILSRGFSEEESGRKSVAEYGFRENAVFTWQHIWEIKGGNELAGVITVAPREEVTVSDMSASITTSRETYIENYTMSYPQYILCLRRHGPTSPVTFERDLIQDLSDYTPEVK